MMLMKETCRKQGIKGYIIDADKILRETYPLGFVTVHGNYLTPPVREHSGDD